MYLPGQATVVVRAQADVGRHAIDGDAPGAGTDARSGGQSRSRGTGLSETGDGVRRCAASAAVALPDGRGGDDAAKTAHPDAETGAERRLYATNGHRDGE